MPDTYSFGQQAAQGAAGGILGIGFQALGNSLQGKQQQRLQDMAVQGQKQLMDYQNEKQYQMWLKTNYPEQVKQLETAGLNPALLYGQSGGGGTTVGGGMPSVGGAHAEGAMGIMNNAMAAANLGLLEAQKENIQADTANKEADTANKPKQGTNIDADTALKQSQTKLQQIQGQIQGATVEDQIRLIQETADQSVTTADILTNQLSLDRQTRELKVTQLQTQIADTLVQIALGKSQQQVNAQTIQKMKVDMKNAITTTDQNERQLYINALKADFDMNHPGVWNVIGGAIQGAAQKLGQAMGDKVQTTAEGAATKHK